MNSNGRLKLLWRRWYVKATVVTVMVIALLAVVWFVALKPTYTADEVLEKMETYLKRKNAWQEARLNTFGEFKVDTQRTSCYEWVLLGARFSKSAPSLKGVLGAPHYIPYRKAWLITAERLWDGRLSVTWLFDEQSGTIASSDPRC